MRRPRTPSTNGSPCAHDARYARRAMPPREYGAPKQVDATAPGDYLEVMTKAAFQAGMSWDVVEASREK